MDLANKETDAVEAGEMFEDIELRSFDIKFHEVNGIDLQVLHDVIEGGAGNLDLLWCFFGAGEMQETGRRPVTGLV